MLCSITQHLQIGHVGQAQSDGVSQASLSVCLKGCDVYI